MNAPERLAAQPPDINEVLGKDLIHLNAHDTDLLPCLCKKCIPSSSETVDANGEEFQREYAVAKGRVLFFWMPVSLVQERAQVRRAVASAMHERLT